MKEITEKEIEQEIQEDEENLRKKLARAELKPKKLKEIKEAEKKAETSPKIVKNEKSSVLKKVFIIFAILFMVAFAVNFFWLNISISNGMFLGNVTVETPVTVNTPEIPVNVQNNYNQTNNLNLNVSINSPVTVINNSTNSS